MPIQRVMRYRILLEVLIKRLTRENSSISTTHSSNIKKLRNALKQVTQVSFHIDKSIDRRENMNKVLEISEMVEGTDPRLKNLVSPTRAFIKQGKLYYLRDAVETIGQKTAQKIIGGGTPAPKAKATFLSTNPEDEGVVCVGDLVITNVKLGDRRSGSRKYTFEVVSPTTRKYYLQADNEEDCQSWVEAIQGQIMKSLSTLSVEPSSSGATVDNGAASSEVPEEILATLKRENPFCGDCGTAAPQWVSANLGFLMCIDCSGVHRSLGSHVSKVRSLALDLWSPSSLELLMKIGNTGANEAYLPESSAILSPEPSASRATKGDFIRMKYVEKAFAEVMEPRKANAMLYAAAAAGDVRAILKSLASGADINYMNFAAGRKSPLHAACIVGSAVAVELLCHNGAQIETTDEDGRSPLDYAKKDEIVDILVMKLQSDILHDADISDRRESIGGRR